MRTSIWFSQVGQPAGLQDRSLHRKHRTHFQRLRVFHPPHSTPVFSESLSPVHRTSSQLSSPIEHRDPADPRNPTDKTEFTEKLTTPEKVSGSQARTVSPRDPPMCLQLSHVNYLTTNLHKWKQNPMLKAVNGFEHLIDFHQKFSRKNWFHYFSSRFFSWIINLNEPQGKIMVETQHLKNTQKKTRFNVNALNFIFLM